MRFWYRWMNFKRQLNADSLLPILVSVLAELRLAAFVKLSKVQPQ